MSHKGVDTPNYTHFDKPKTLEQYNKVVSNFSFKRAKWSMISCGVFYAYVRIRRPKGFFHRFKMKIGYNKRIFSIVFTACLSLSFEKSIKIMRYRVYITHNNLRIIVPPRWGPDEAL